ncbi:MAG: GIY-YIG nuclease family protein [Gemmatimonadaceae bacterium]
MAEITTRIVQVLEVPRSMLSEFLAMPESDQVAVYFLVGEGDEGAEPHVYVGQSGDIRARLSQHHKQKDFWERALVLVSRTDSLTQTHALFLEWHCIQSIHSAGRYVPENVTKGGRPHALPPLEADCLEIFETAQVLLSTLGYPLFDAVAKVGAESGGAQFFACRSSGADGQGLYTPDGFVVLKGSRGRKEVVKSVKGTSVAKQRETLQAAGVLVPDGDMLVFARDHLFRTPSGAATALMGRSANGWVEWKAKDGQTLDAVKRQSVQA